MINNKKIVNICYEALERNLLGQQKDKVAIRYIDPQWTEKSKLTKDITYQELTTETNKFANILKNLGIKKGDVLFSLSPRCPELYTVALGALRAGVVFSPLFSAFGPEPILSRMKKGKVKIIFSYASLFKKKILPIINELPSTLCVLLIDDDGSLKNFPYALNFNTLMQEASSANRLEKTGPEDAALLHFTSGTTGEPKGALHVHQSVFYHKSSGPIALDLKPQDIFWCTADPGWVTGTSYGIISPLCNGATLLIDGSEFNAKRWYQILDNFKVDIWYTSPTALRMLMRAGEDLPKQYDLSHIRFAASVGEPLNPEVIEWVKKNLKIIIHDNWWQTETGGIMIGNFVSLPIRPGSMGKPLPGVVVALIKEIKGDDILFVENNNEIGEIAIKKNWDSMFRGYLNELMRYKKCFAGEWYLSGDLAKRDQDGYYWFIGRKDDVIKTSGHLIGPFEIESLLMEHPAILEAAAIGIPDPIAGQLIKAFVVLKKGFKQTPEQKSEILSYARTKLGVAIAPREISFIDTLPKTRSGKIMRRLLKAKELGLPEGDISTLESNNGP